MSGGLLLVGCGKMGGAMLDGWIDRGMALENITVIEPSADAAEVLRNRHAVAVLGSVDELQPSYHPSVVVLAVKPQAMDGVVPAYARYAGADTVFLSIAAGKSIAYFENLLGGAAVIVRSMPNTPAAVRRGITVACANARTAPAQIDACDDLLEAVGEVAWVDDEGLLDPVTAVSGSGPAYVFLLAEAMAEAGRAAGLPDDLAMRLARATVAGAGELLRQSPEAPGTLRENVTSPGGTTAEALKVLMGADGMRPLMTSAVAAATRRSRELAG
ncbi:MAG: pyrroline-5-carboxylate reductase [Rhodospirillales bacterium]|nr:pyrroline-5-carboxylate reductase [Rhodospirillales bacterium]